MRSGSFLGSALTYGIAPIHMKVTIQNPAAHTKTTDTHPVFYFFFDDSNPGTAGPGTWLAGAIANVSSPGEFSLVKLNQKGDHREATVGSASIGGFKSGVMDKERIAFTYDLVRPGVFKVTPSVPLPNGEYGFLYSLGGAGGAAGARIFDFSIS